MVKGSGAMTNEQKTGAALLGRIIAYVVAGATAFAALQTQVKEHTCKIDDHEKRLRPVEVAVIEQRADIQYIKQALDDIKHAIKP